MLRRRRPHKAELRAQIEAVRTEKYPTEPIEQRIAAALRDSGRFEADLGANELATILRSIVHTLLEQYRIAGRDPGLVHNVPVMDVEIAGSQAEVEFIVHLHQPITAFLELHYVLINDPAAVGRKLRVRHGSMQVDQHVRRFDLKSRAALAAINVENIVRQELSDLTGVIIRTLPPQLARQGVQGLLTQVELTLLDGVLRVYLEGKFWPAEAGNRNRSQPFASD